MKCTIPRCGEQSEGASERDQKHVPPPLALCTPHQNRYRNDYRLHCSSFRQSHTEAQARSWQATWIQMVDLEMLNVGIGAQRGEWATVDGVDVWVPEGTAAPNASYPHYKARKPDPLPEHAYRSGQAAIAKREAEQQLLERKLAAETQEFNRGQRQVLELELKTKRATESRARDARTKKP